MGKLTEIDQEIARAVGSPGIRGAALPHEDALRVLERLRERFARPRSFPLWERAPATFSRQDAKAWSWIGEYFAGSSILLLEEEASARGFQFERGVDLQRVLEETFGFEFYVTDASCDAFLCFNHHDVLIAAGSAVPWLQARGVAS
jgi:hypothetical protein